MKVIVCLFLLNSSLVLAQSIPKVNPSRMEQRITELGKYGTNPQGGVTRLAYSDADKQGRQYIIGLMESSGLTVLIDAAGNIIGKRAGKNPSLPTIAFGSHIDS